MLELPKCAHPRSGELTFDQSQGIVTTGPACIPTNENAPPTKASCTRNRVSTCPAGTVNRT